MKKFLKKIRNRIKKLWYKPIPIFIFHQVSKEFNPLVDKQSNWTSFNMFVKNIEVLQRKYTFISLEDAAFRLKKKCFRWRYYAVITFDDGYLSILEALNYLQNKRIPYTLFLNSAYFDKKSFSSVNAEIYVNNISSENRNSIPNEIKNALLKLRKIDNENDYLNAINTIKDRLNLEEVINELYLSKEQVFDLCNSHVTIGMHGYEHLNSLFLSDKSFEKNILINCNDLKYHPRFIPFYAFAWGNAKDEQIYKVIKLNFIPVLSNGEFNYGGSKSLSRCSIDGNDVRKIKKLW